MNDYVSNPGSGYTTTFIAPEMSDWVCYLFGNRPGGMGFVYRPRRGAEPHMLARWMMRVCFDCLWVKRPPSTGDRQYSSDNPAKPTE